MHALKYFVLFSLFNHFLCFCPPLVAPETTQITCKDPLKRQRVSCSSSWLPAGTIVHFRCQKEFKRSVKGRIVCFEDGEHQHRPDLGNFTIEYLPCGIRTNVQIPDIHIYGYKAPAHFDLPNKTFSSGKNGVMSIFLIETDYLLLGEALHKKFRKNHNSPPLKLQQNLTKLAQDWAENISSNGRLDMASNLPFGQNVFLVPNTTNLSTAVNDAVHNWYYSGRSEYCWEDVTKNWNNSLALQFSQMIWKNSKFLGIGAAALRNGAGTAVVALYDPSGNVLINGDEESSDYLFKLNVLPLHVNNR